MAVCRDFPPENRWETQVTAQFLIGCGAGFSGDRTDAPIPVVRELARRGGPSAIFFETLGERTLALAQLRRLEDPGEGHEPLLEELLRPVLADCLAADIAVIGNFGAANPEGAARRIAGLCAAAGVPDVPIGVVEGDAAGFGKKERPAAPLEEVLADPLLELADLGRDRRLRHV